MILISGNCFNCDIAFDKIFSSSFVQCIPLICAMIVIINQGPNFQKLGVNSSLKKIMPKFDLGSR